MIQKNIFIEKKVSQARFLMNKMRRRQHLSGQTKCAAGQIF